MQIKRENQRFLINEIETTFTWLQLSCQGLILSSKESALDCGPSSATIDAHFRLNFEIICHYSCTFLQEFSSSN